MFRTAFFNKVIGGIIILLLVLALSSQAQEDPFSGCGTIWADSGCFVLDLDGNHETYYILDTIVSVCPGEWGCVYGTFDIFCDTSCASATGCITVDSIIPQQPPDTTIYLACGILIQGSDCILFDPISGPILDEGFYLVLDNYDIYGVGDTVCVSGLISYDTIPECPEAAGHLLGNTIDVWAPSNSPFSDCGILVMDLGCLLFMPLSQPDTLYYLENYGQFVAGDTVCVSGTLIYGCDTTCPSADACIGGNSIYAWQNDGWPFEECGVLEQGIDCIVFALLDDTIYLALDYIGLFIVGDTVCVSGIVDWNCDLGCSSVSGCIYTSNIEDRIDFYHNFEMIIKLAEGYEIDPILSIYGGVPIDSIIPSNIYLVGFPQSQLVEVLGDSLQILPGVVFVQPNYTVGFPETFHVSQTFPDDSQPILNWGVTPVAYFTDSVGYTINSDSANLYSAGENVVVAVIDNGVDMGHPLLINSFADFGYDFIDNDGDPSEEDGDLLGHGTFICGVIRRIAPESKFLPIRAFNADGLGNSFTLANSIQYAIDQSVDAINMSFGSYTSNPIIQEAVDNAVEAGISLIAAVGNSGTNIPSYPAAYPGVIAVSALDTMEYRADFSNYGDYVDICAPGVNIYSSLAGTFQWGNWSGTSFAAPMVSGVCALILSEEDELTPYQIESLIQQTAENDLLWGSFSPPSEDYGYGRVDALEPVTDASRGDVDNSQAKDIMDITYLINMLYKNGPEPLPTKEMGDTDCSVNINLFDIVYLIKYLYLDGPRPSCLAE